MSEEGSLSISKVDSSNFHELCCFVTLVFCLAVKLFDFNMYLKL